MKLYLSILLATSAITVSAQCITGNCDNGTGTANWKYGTYSGSFTNGQPDGKGIYTGLIERPFNRDSIKDEGLFQFGTFVSGTRTTYKKWSKFFWDPCKERLGPCSFPKEGHYWVVPDAPVKAEPIDYPVKDKQRSTSWGKTTEVTYYRFVTPDGDGFSWTGGVKSGLMHGEGSFLGDSIELKVVFDKGIPVQTATMVAGKLPRYGLTLAFTNGLITSNYQFTKDSIAYRSTEPRSIYDFIVAPHPTGVFDVTYKDGSRYSGQVVNGVPHGIGQVWHKSGSTYKGYFYHGLSHGEGVLTDALGQRDSGLFYFNRFAKGTAFRNGKAPFAFPVCQSGNCADGLGKASFRTVPNDTLYDVYEGYFVNGLPAGYGVRTYRNGKYSHTYKGNFSGGLLMGQGEITANYSYIRKMSGYFHRDSLLRGAIYYYDGTRFDFSENKNDNKMYVAMTPPVFGQVRSKQFMGNGTYYLKSGSRVTGFFNFYGSLVRGEYTNSQGITMNLGNEYQSSLAYYGANGNWDADNLDNVVATIQQRKQFAEDEKRRRAARYAQEQEWAKKQEAELDNPANWSTTSKKVRCGACNGEGEFVYSNTFGRGERKYTTQYGTKVTVVYDKGRTYTHEVKCTACNGKGEISVTSRHYIGKS